MLRIGGTERQKRRVRLDKAVAALEKLNTKEERKRRGGSELPGVAPSVVV